MDHDAILVTGTSTGIGRALALLLARQGFTVFAGVRTDAHAAVLANEHPAIRPILLDVAVPDDCARAAETLRAAGHPLRGLVCNAGIAIAGPIEFLPRERWREQFEVNLFGALDLARACIPLVRAARGRIVFVGSIAGRLAPPLLAPYAASKAALEAATDALRVELAASGIGVTLIVPGAVRTPIWQKGRDRADALAAAISGDGIDQYAALIAAARRASAHAERHGIAPDDVAHAVLRALTARRAPAHVLVGKEARMQDLVRRFLPARWRDALLRRALGIPAEEARAFSLARSESRE
jgi:NAD(P)-dependent dehydrogenase (short-subunit alcohol dehydrogenase family)